jgi:adenosylcobyric acid synthase
MAKAGGNMCNAIMIQGAGSNVGKSMLVAGLCRAFRARGLTVRPFKPQNMSNNAAVTTDGGEIGRAQALQSLACGVEPHTDMNPVLLKPESEVGAQVIVLGQRLDTVAARDYAKLKPKLMAAVLDSFNRLRADADLVIVEGAGSPAEINLRAGDIANMGFAEAAKIPVILTGDIDRGGVIAQLVGTKAVLSPEDNTLIKGFIINKFRGDPILFDDGLAEITKRTNWPCIGVVPWFDEAHILPAEDIMDITSTEGGKFKIAVPRLSRIANFDDLDPLAQEPDISIEIVEAGQPLPGDADLVLIPGSKSTIVDLAYFRAQGWDIDLTAHIRRGGHVLGICGGYQMLGRQIIDNDGIEGAPCRVDGLGHLDVVTEMQPEKHLTTVDATLADATPLKGYEIHIGETSGPDCARAWLNIGERQDGAASANGRIKGTYLHGIFASDKFRTRFLSDLGAQTSTLDYGAEVEQTLDALAAHLERHLDLDTLLELAR